MKDYHQIQLVILQKLLYSEGLKYSQIKPTDMEGSQFTFHLDQLLKSEFIEKVEDRYKLTDSGKEFANRMDLGDTKIENQAKISVIMVCQRITNGEKEYLLYTRLKSPFYSYQGFPTGKVKRGEDVLEAAKRELKEETGLNGNPEIFCIRHYKITNKNGDLLEDKIFFACKFENATGDLVNNPEGSYKWVAKDEIWDYLKKPVPEVKEIIENLDATHITFKESSYSTEGF